MGCINLNFTRMQTVISLFVIGWPVKKEGSNGCRQDRYQDRPG